MRRIQDVPCAGTVASADDDAGAEDALAGMAHNQVCTTRSLALSFIVLVASLGEPPVAPGLPC
jgi:hypothetical protein